MCVHGSLIKGAGGIECETILGLIVTSYLHKNHRLFEVIYFLSGKFLGGMGFP